VTVSGVKAVGNAVIEASAVTVVVAVVVADARVAAKVAAKVAVMHRAPARKADAVVAKVAQEIGLRRIGRWPSVRNVVSVRNGRIGAIALWMRAPNGSRVKVVAKAEAVVATSAASAPSVQPR
jgi:dissimilatory sulfite reductase (desulfoviridin) alpha/beta subunit